MSDYVTYTLRFESVQIYFNITAALAFYLHQFRSSEKGERDLKTKKINQVRLFEIRLRYVQVTIQ